MGYGWPWTVRAGDAIDFKVSTYADGPYRADLVRLICGDDLSDPAMFKEKEVPAPFSGTYPGRLQAIHTGSYVEIDPRSCLDRLESFTVQAMVCPTALPRASAQRLTNSSVAALAWPPNQHLISRWDQSTRSGWALLIDDHDRLAFLMGDGETLHLTSLAACMVEHHWFFVMASFDASKRQICLSAQPIPKAPCELLTWPATSVAERIADTLKPVQHGPLRFAAAADGPGNGSRSKPIYCFNGRLDRVRLCRGVLDQEKAWALAGTQIPESLREKIVAFWDFGQGIDTINVHDRSGNGLDGITVNLPTRAVAGVDWNGSFNDWHLGPDHYSAIHFHDDDLYDAQWQTDFSFCVPQNLPSGIYAARLRHGESEDYIPFFVVPPKGTATAPVALLLPTTTYTAYTSHDLFWDYALKKGLQAESEEWTFIDQDPFPSVLRTAEVGDFLLQRLRERGLGKGVYLHHTDGSYCNTASQKYPNMTIKPKTQNWTLVADTYITDWLEQAGIAYDVITDDLLHAEGVELLKNYTVVMSGNHPEYCSGKMLDAIAEYQRQGGRWMYLGGNGYFLVTSFHSQLPGAIEVRKDILFSGRHPPYELRHAFDGQSGGLWSHNARPPQLLMGVGSVLPLPFTGSAPYDRLPGSYDPRVIFVFEGVTHETFGDYGIIGGGAAGQETDEIDYTQGTPNHALHLARSRDFPWPMAGPDGLTAEEYRQNVKNPRADIVFFEGPEGGAVFSVGSMAWVGALSHNRYQNDVARITENVLRRFMDKAPFSLPKHDWGAD